MFEVTQALGLDDRTQTEGELEAAGGARVFRTQQGGVVGSLGGREEGLAALQEAQDGLLVHHSLLGGLDAAPRRAWRTVGGALLAPLHRLPANPAWFHANS